MYDKIQRKYCIAGRNVLYCVKYENTCLYIADTRCTEGKMKVAVLGYGTVGCGVYEMLKDARGLTPGPVLVRPGKADEAFKVDSLEAIISDGSVEAVAEVIGGVEPAFTYACAVMNAGKHFVTSNKALVAAKGPELAALAEKKGVAFLFSAACGGGVPFLYNMSLAAESDSIDLVGGILNGTTNFILDAMQRRGLTYAGALADAQKLGYAEADPTADVTGLDALRKIMLACAVAFGKLPVEGLNNEGIDSFTAEDAEYLKEKALTCRLIASGMPAGPEAVSAFVEPVLFKRTAPECSVLNNFNMARYHGRCSGDIVLMGQGAGRWPTASAVLRDLSAILSGRKTMMDPGVECVRADNSAILRRYCVRLPAGSDISLPVEKEEIFGENKYIYTADVPVSIMHAKAETFRKGGAKLFFAAIGQ